MSKKELKRILKNLCDYKEWCIIKPSLYISDDHKCLIVDVYDKTYGSLYHVFMDVEKRYFTYQFLSAFGIHDTKRNSLDRFM